MSNQTSETIIVNEVPLLLEKNMKDLYDFLVVVVSSQKNRLDRLAKNGLTAEQALSRMAKQIDDETRKNAADFLIINDGNLEQLDSDVERIWQTLKERNFKS